jgi:signal transduction histidine kinase
MGAARLVPQADGYADYVDRTYAPGPPSGLPRGQGQHRSPGRPRGKRTARQRSIRSTITILLVIPLLSLVALWGYAATGAIGSATSNRQVNEVNTDIGYPTQILTEQLSTETADTYVWQLAKGHLPRTAMVAQRPKTDAAIAAFEAGAAAAFRTEPSANKPAAQAVLASLRQIGALRAQVDAGKISAVAAFQAYNGIESGLFPFAFAFSAGGPSIALAQESQALLQEGEAAVDIGQEATLVGGAQVAGDRMTAAELRVFAQTVDNQRLLQQQGGNPLSWQVSADPYAGIAGSKAFTTLTKLQDEIIAAKPGALLPVSPASWQQAIGAVVAQFTVAETSSRLGVTKGDAHASDIILLRLILVGGAGLVAVVLSSLLLLRFGNRIGRELSGLRGAARSLAEERLPSVVSRLRRGDAVDVDTEAPPLALDTKTREVTETAAAFSEVRRTAIEAAVEQAQLRQGVSLVFRSLARRNASLLQRELKMLDQMERNTEDPEALAQLFQLDHLTTRMRRHAEGLIILSGAAPGRSWRQPVPVVEALRGALGEIEDYARVDLVSDTPDFLQGSGVADVTHLLAEVIENAVLYSPPATRVQVRCSRVANGYAIEIEDRGLGIPDDIRSALNERLANPPEFDLANSDQLGLFVVSRLAARQQVKVQLRPSAYGGTLAIVLLPHSLVVSEEQSVFLAAQAVPGRRTVPSARAVPAGQAASAGAPPSVSAGRAVPAARAVPAGSGAAQRPGAITGPGPAAGSGAASATGAAEVRRSSLPAASGDRSAGLPKRQPMTSMAPQLKESRGPSPRGALSGRSPEQARALLSSIRNGWQSGIASSAGDGAFPGQGSDGGSGEPSGEEPR